jgi:hypothetical protein
MQMNESKREGSSHEIGVLAHLRARRRFPGLGALLSSVLIDPFRQSFRLCHPPPASVSFPPSLPSPFLFSIVVRQPKHLSNPRRSTLLPPTMLSYALLASLPLLASACHPDYQNVIKRQQAATPTAPPLASLSGGMSTLSIPIPTTASAGAQPSLTGAPPLPSCGFLFRSVVESLELVGWQA